MQRIVEPIAADRTGRLLARAQSRAALPLLAFAVFLLIAVLLVGHEIKDHITAVEAWIAQLGPWGVLAFVGLFALGTSLLLPESVFGVAAGALFGMTLGIMVAVAGSLLAGVLQYTLSRQLLRARIQRTLSTRPLLAAIQRAVMRDEIRLQILLRLTPLNPATISYLLGAAGVRLPGFLLACVALWPHLFIEVYLGHAGKHLLRTAVGDPQISHLRDLEIIGALAVGILAVVILSRVAHKAILHAVAEAGPETANLGHGSA